MLSIMVYQGILQLKKLNRRTGKIYLITGGTITLRTLWLS
jgi:hypothetical protein